MKTHEVAQVLSELARVLRHGPDVPLEEVGKHERRRIDSASIPVALSTLVALSDVDKAQWTTFINAHKLPIAVRPRDASRDILGKVLKYLEQNPDARRLITSVAQKGRSETSPELQKALEFLLR